MSAIVIDWNPTVLILRQLATTLGETPSEHLPKGAVVDTLNQVADRLLAGEVVSPAEREAYQLSAATDRDEDAS